MSLFATLLRRTETETGDETREERLATDERPDTDEAPPADDGGSGGWLRKSLLALVLLGVAVVIVSRVRDRDVPVTAALPESVTDAIGDSERRPDEQGARAVDSAPDEDAANETGTEPATTDTPTAESTTETVTDSTDESETADEEPSREEIEERTVDDAHEEPAEPGEMTVDEEVAEELETDEASQ